MKARRNGVERTVRVGSLTPARCEDECPRCGGTIWRLAKIPALRSCWATGECTGCAARLDFGLAWWDRAPTLRDIDRALARNARQQSQLRALAGRLRLERARVGR